MVDRLVDLYDVIAVQQLQVPDFVAAHDARINGTAVTATQTHDAL